jgi:hypothetical protein
LLMSRPVMRRSTRLREHTGDASTLPRGISIIATKQRRARSEEAAL